MDFVSRSTGKAIGEHRIKWGGKTLLDLDYADDLSILDESCSEMNELLDESVNKMNEFLDFASSGC